MKLIIDHENCDFYVGPLEPAKQIMYDAYGEESITVRRDANRVVVVEHAHVTDTGTTVQDLLDVANQWGSSGAGDEEEAWRFLLGADFGPVDEEYDDDRLRKLISEYEGRA